MEKIYEKNVEYTSPHSKNKYEINILIKKGFVDKFYPDLSVSIKIYNFGGWELKWVKVVNETEYIQTLDKSLISLISEAVNEYETFVLEPVEKLFKREDIKEMN